MIVCTKSWFDGLLGRPYGWHKTPRTGHGQERTIDTADLVRRRCRRG